MDFITDHLFLLSSGIAFLIGLAGSLKELKEKKSNVLYFVLILFLLFVASIAEVLIKSHELTENKKNAIINRQFQDSLNRRSVYIIDSLNKSIDLARSILITSVNTAKAINETFAKQSFEIAQQNALLTKTENVLRNEEAIYEINKKIKFPLPEIVKVSYRLTFTLDSSVQRIADTFLLRNMHNDCKNYCQIPNDVFDQLMNKIYGHRLFSYFADMRINFAQGYEVNNNFVSSNSVFFLEPIVEEVSMGDFNFFYDYDTKVFTVWARNIKLQRAVINWYIKYSLTANSLFDLKNSTMIFESTSLLNLKSVNIKEVEISSKEFNHLFMNFKNTINASVFISKVE